MLCAQVLKPLPCLLGQVLENRYVSFPSFHLCLSSFSHRRKRSSIIDSIHGEEL